MKVTSLVKKKNGYEVSFEHETYILDEETVLQFRLLCGKEIEDYLVNSIKQFDEKQKVANKALEYAIRYSKSAKEVVRYLELKDYSKYIAETVVDSLIEKGLINDEILAVSLAGSLARNSNGPMMIKQKLMSHFFTSETIDIALNSVEESDYLLGLQKLERKLEKRYEKEESFIKKQKIKKALYAHGYTSN